ncbi:MAG: ABC transporter permease [Thiomargarita sp.]|nr:ABC transporter permease [Thiomargarita sp.]
MLASLEIQQNIIYCRGNWVLNNIETVEKQILNVSEPTVATIVFDGSAIQTMDTIGAYLLYRIQQKFTQAGKTIQVQGFKTTHTHLIKIATKYATIPPTPVINKPNFLIYISNRTQEYGQKTLNFLNFIGESSIALIIALISPSRIRWKILFNHLYTDGLTALPIIGLLAFLTGIVLAYQGGTQLSIYGANIFIVDLVGITILREMAPLMTAIIVAGRSGSAYTAQISTMHITEEMDALRTLGMNPIDLLVLPKLLALLILMPLLIAYADVMAIFGSLIIANISFDISISDFLTRFPEAVSVGHYLVGISKAPIFAAIIVLVSCYQGFQIKVLGTDQIGKQVTTSVVQAIFLVITSDALLSILFNMMGIGLQYY